jgi:hypothetical protein
MSIYRAKMSLEDSNIVLIKSIYLEKGLTIAILPEDFNIPIPNEFFYEGLVEIHFGNSFNQPVEKGMFPASLKTLSFGDSFNQPISEGVVPNGCHLNLSLTYCKQLPRGLTGISFRDSGIVQPDQLETVLQNYKYTIDSSVTGYHTVKIASGDPPVQSDGIKFMVVVPDPQSFIDIIRIISYTLEECNMIFSKNGICISNLCRDKSKYIKANISAKYIRGSSYTENPVTITVETSMLVSQLALLPASNDNIVIYTVNDTHIYIEYDSATIYPQVQLRIPLLISSEDDIKMPSVEFHSTALIAPIQFNKICKTFYKKTHDIMGITVDGNQIIFSNKDGYQVAINNQRTISKTAVFNVGYFPYDSLREFMDKKCFKKCQNLLIYFKTDYPMVLRVSCGDLHEVYIFITGYESF